MTLVSRAWMLDAVEFHREFDALLADALSGPRGDALRTRAASMWRETDPIARTYLEVLRVAPPDFVTPSNRAREIETADLADWYRLLMAGYLTPTRAFRAPDVLKRRLPELGWTPSEARRLAHGRPLQSLADTYADGQVIARVAPDLALGERGWLTQDDVTAALDRLRALDPRVFRHRQELVAVVEQAHEVLEAAATKPDLVLLLLAD
jgi:hypothetical protein